MLITCWSSKGGSGTTVVAAALACLLAADAGDVLLVDLSGDLPAALGLPEPLMGLTAWVPSGDPDGRDLTRFEFDAAAGVRLLPRGPGIFGPGTGVALARALAGRGCVVVDAGVLGGGGPAVGAAALAEGEAGRDVLGPGLDLAAAATASLLVLRPCFLALRRAVAAPLRGSGVVLVDEPQRVLGPADIEAALGVPVVAVVPWDPVLARRVDAGLLGSALPRAVSRALLRAAPQWAPGAAGRTWRPEAIR